MLICLFSGRLPEDTFENTLWRKAKYMWLHMFTCRRFEGTFENAQWRKAKQMQPMWLCIFSGKRFEETFENPQWRKIKQMQPEWLCMLWPRIFEETYMKRQIVEKWLLIILSRSSEGKKAQQIVIEFKYDDTFCSPRQMKYGTSTASSLIDFYWTQVYLGSVLWVPISLTQSLMFCWPNWCVSGGQIYNQCK